MSANDNTKKDALKNRILPLVVKQLAKGSSKESVMERLRQLGFTKEESEEMIQLAMTGKVPYDSAPPSPKPIQTIPQTTPVPESVEKPLLQKEEQIAQSPHPAETKTDLPHVGEENKCPKCGEINEIEAKYCIKCGLEIKSQFVKQIDKNVSWLGNNWHYTLFIIIGFFMILVPIFVLLDFPMKNKWQSSNNNQLLSEKVGNINAEHKKIELEEKPEADQPGQEPEGKVLAPEAYYQFEVDRLFLLKDHKSKFLQLLKSANTKDQILIDKVINANKLIVSDFIILTDKEKITAPDYKKTNTDPEAKKANDEYIAKHPEIKEKMTALQGEVVKIEEEIKTEVERLKITQEDLASKATPQEVNQSNTQPQNDSAQSAAEIAFCPPRTSEYIIKYCWISENKSFNNATTYNDIVESVKLFNEMQTAFGKQPSSNFKKVYSSTFQMIVVLKAIDIIKKYNFNDYNIILYVIMPDKTASSKSIYGSDAVICYDKYYLNYEKYNKELLSVTKNNMSAFDDKSDTYVQGLLKKSTEYGDLYTNCIENYTTSKTGIQFDSDKAKNLAVGNDTPKIAIYQMQGYSFKCPSDWEANLGKVSGYLLTPEAVAASKKYDSQDLIEGMKVNLFNRDQKEVDSVVQNCKGALPELIDCTIEKNAGGPGIDEFIRLTKSEETGDRIYDLDMSIPLPDGKYIGVSAIIPQQGDKKFTEIYNRLHNQYRLLVKSIVIQKEK